MEIPKNLNRNSPENANAMMVNPAIITAFLAVLFRSLLDKSEVMLRKIGITPKGLMRVKNDVKYSKKTVKCSLIFIRFERITFYV